MYTMIQGAVLLQIWLKWHAPGTTLLLARYAGHTGYFLHVHMHVSTITLSCFHVHTCTTCFTVYVHLLYYRIMIIIIIIILLQLLQNIFFARLPYANRDLGAGPIATRFIGLAAVGNTRKEKFLHALQVTPAAQMDATQLVALPGALMHIVCFNKTWWGC